VNVVHLINPVDIRVSRCGTLWVRPYLAHHFTKNHDLVTCKNCARYLRWRGDKP
jgi:hypothetical protein